MGAERGKGSRTAVRCAAVAAALFAVASVPAAALGAARYATVAGSEPACTESSPCSITTAFAGALAGDDIYIDGAHGPYKLVSSLGIKAPVHIHGWNARPDIQISAGGLSVQAGSTAEWLRVSTTSKFTAFSVEEGSRASQVIAEDGSTGHACYLKSATLIDSVCDAGVEGDLAVESDGENVLRNDTLWGGTKAALRTFGREKVDGVDRLINVVARSAPGAVDLEPLAEGGQHATISAEFSNFSTTHLGGEAAQDTVSAGTGNQSGAPLFASPATADFHELAGSPTICAGVTNEANGTSDVYLAPRVTAGATDIGAAQYQTASSCGGGSSGGGSSLRPTATAVSCNYVVATAVDECFATVGDAGPPPASGPTGTVKFTTTGTGLFMLGSTCALTTSASSPTTAGCSAEYLPGLGEGPPNVVAAYSGDVAHAGSSGSTRFFTPGDATSVSAAPGAPGAYPGSVSVTTVAPAGGSDVTACAVPAGGRAAAALVSLGEMLEGLYRELAEQAAAGGPQPKTSAQVSQEIEQLLAQPETQAALTDSNAAKRQALEEAFKTIEGVIEGSCQPSQTIQLPPGKVFPAFGSRVSAKRHARVRTRRVRHTILASARARHVGPGRAVIRLKLSPARLASVAHGRSAVTLLVPITIIAPSAHLRSGVPTFVVELIRVRRAPRRGHRH